MAMFAHMLAGPIILAFPTTKGVDNENDSDCGILTVILSGCIPQTMHFTRPGLTYEEWNRDFGECAYIEHSRACGGYGSSSSVYGSTISTTYNLDCSQDLPIESFDTAIRAGVIVTGQSLDQKTDRRDQLIGLCLRAKGYVEQRAE